MPTKKLKVVTGKQFTPPRINGKEEKANESG